jgi:tetratricopeptide (TPR) repeat protein
MSDSGSKIRKLATFVKENPNDSFSKFALALELLKNNQAEKALLLFESIYNKDPEYLGTYYHLGKLYQRLGRSDDAIRCFGEGIELAGQKQDQRTRSELKEALLEVEMEQNDE